MTINKKWWMEAVGYQIYPRSFLDSNNDGIGDLPGIISKLDYLKDLGINLVWLCPIYKSPMDDNGYDVSDFFDIAQEYGTMEDAKTLIKEAHARGIHVIMDLVLNHTSDEHPWFVEARKSKDNPYRDYYIWQDPKYDADGNKLPPNNLASFFEGSCWKYDETTDQYFMKIFSDKMPDLNWINPKLRKAMIEMATWWLDQGIDGFRIDAIAHLGRDLTFSDGEVTPGRKYSQDWSKFSNRPEIHDYLKELNREVFSKYDCVTVGEAGGGATPEQALSYSGYDSHEMNMTFTFDHCWENGAYGADTKTDDEIVTNLISLKNQFTKWQLGLYGKGWNPIYWLNHDHPRVVSQYGDPKNYHKESAKCLCNALYFLWGTPFIYNGEEIGMTNVDYTSVEQFNDVWVKTYYGEAKERGLSEEQILTHLRRSSRANARTPMHWSADEYAGFSKHKPWIDCISNYKEINVASQINDEDSILSHYKKVIKLRRDSEYKETIVYGTYECVDYENKDVYSYIREHNNQRILVVSNFFAKDTKVDLPYNIKKVIISNYKKEYKSLNNLTLSPFESVVFEIE